VSGWLGAASIKWFARIEVSEECLYVPWNTEDYVLIEPFLTGHATFLHGITFAGENAIAAVEYRIDDGP
jgi:DMSO/TMAO reductase YedYZ molybdopterin-dependent catalytic subunit